MKRLLTILLLLIAGIVSAQETPPALLKSVNSQFYIRLADNSMWQNKGTPYGWHRVAKYSELQDELSGLQDSLDNKVNRTFDNVASGAIANIKLANSTISGVALGGTLNALTAGYGLSSGGTFTGATARTFQADTAALQTVANFFPKGDTRYLRSSTASSTYQLISNLSTNLTASATKYPSVNAVNAGLSLYLPLAGGTLTGPLFGTSATFSGLITSTVGNNQRIFNANSATTGYQYLQLQNTGANFIWGIDNNAGGQLATGSSPYSSVITSVNSTSIHLGTNQVVRYTIDASGNNTWTGSGTFNSLSGSGDVIVSSNNSGLLGKVTIGSGLSLTSGVLTATGGSSGSITSSGGTAGKIAKFTSASNVENSIITESGGSISIAGNIASTSGNNQVLYYNGSATNGYQYFNLENTGGELIMGIEGSTAGSLMTGGSAYATVLTTIGATNLELGTNQNKRVTIAHTTGNVAITGAVSASNFSGTSSGTNTGDQTTITGNAGTATALQTARTISGTSFDGTANITLNNTGITNGAGYITASSSNTLTNKSGNISQWTNDSGYITASSSNTLTNKSGNISQWINDSGYITSSALSTYAPLASPALTGTPTAPTQTQGDNSTKIATTAYVDAAAAIASNINTFSLSGDGTTTSFNTGIVAETSITPANLIIATPIDMPSSIAYTMSKVSMGGGTFNWYVVFATPPASGTSNITFTYQLD
jgi:hypothetical protein